MKVQKAGCILINLNLKKVGLVYRERRGDFSFPKGHLEFGETLRECAVRETEEETGRKCHIISSEVDIHRFLTPLGEDAEVYYYIAVDDGASNKKIDESLKENLIWKEFDDVYDLLSYDNLKDMWLKVKDRVEALFKY